MATATSAPTISQSQLDKHEQPPLAGGAGGDPLVLGLPLIAVGAVALGLQLVGYVSISSNGSPLAVLLGGSGLGLLIATVWASRITHQPASSPWANGSSLPTTVLGSLATFFLSYAVLVLGLTHDWFAILPADATHTVALFQISWIATFAFLALASIRLPVVFTILFVAFIAALAFLLDSTLAPSVTAAKIAGIIVLVIAAAAGYVFLAIASRASGGPEYPIGPPIA